MIRPMFRVVEPLLRSLKDTTMVLNCHKVGSLTTFDMIILLAWTIQHVPTEKQHFDK